MPLLVSSNNPGQASRIVRPNLVRPAVAFDILTVPDLLRVMLYKANPPYGPQNSLIISGDPAANGETVWMVADQRLVADPMLTGLRDQASNGGEQLIMQADGLQPTDTFQDLTIGNTPIQTGLTEFTAYLWGTMVDGTIWVPCGNNVGLACLYAVANAFAIQDDGATAAFGSFDTTPGNVLARVSVAANGDYSIIATGNPAEVTGNESFTTFSLNLVANGTVQQNGDTGNRHRGQIFVERVIALNSPEDLDIRNKYISVVDPGYTL